LRTAFPDDVDYADIVAWLEYWASLGARFEAD
jgi:hypothetical protein